ELFVPPDDRPGEGGGEGMKPTFPHDISKLDSEALRNKLYRITPQAIDDVFTLALDAVDALALGQDDEPDLLVVSISTTDFIGHNYGPDSLEQLDTLRRADVSLRRFLAALDARVHQRYVVAVSADHGAPPLPLAAEGARYPHGILLETDVEAAAQNAAAAALPKDSKKRVLGYLPPHITLDIADLAPDAQRKVKNAVMAAVEAVPGVARVYDFDDPAAVDPLEPLMRASHYPGRTGVLAVRQRARVVTLNNAQKTGTDHGTPYTYDRRVPVLFAGPGVKRGRYAQPIDPRDVAPTLAFLLHVAPPDMCEGKPVVAVGD
ncbi:MAG TPA: alkaline phosphatase family protein, partial [Myxococcota bacterium]